MTSGNTLVFKCWLPSLHVLTLRVSSLPNCSGPRRQTCERRSVSFSIKWCDISFLLYRIVAKNKKIKSMKIFINWSTIQLPYIIFRGRISLYLFTHELQDIFACVYMHTYICIYIYILVYTHIHVYTGTKTWFCVFGGVFIVFFSISKELIF